MGTLVQAYQLTEADYRGERFRDHSRDLRGDTDLICLTRPDIVAAIHGAYLDAGADIIETNTFTATRIAQADYGLESVVVEINREGARIARAGRRPGRGRGARSSPLRDGRARADQPDRLDLAGRDRSRRPQRHLRRAGRGVRRSPPRA